MSRYTENDNLASEKVNEFINSIEKFREIPAADRTYVMRARLKNMLTEFAQKRCEEQIQDCAKRLSSSLLFTANERAVSSTPNVMYEELPF